MMQKYGYDITLIFLIIVENLLLLFFHQRGITSQTVNASVFFAVSTLIGAILLFKFYNKKITVFKKSTARKSIWLLPLYFGVILILNAITIPVIKTIDPGPSSDIIPTIQVLVQRFLAGLDPYDAKAYKVLGHQFAPGYLTMHWLPYTIPEIFHFDYRTMTFSIFSIGASVIMLRSIRGQALWIKLCIPLLFLFNYYQVILLDAGDIGVTVEMMVAGYYMLFITAINNKNTLLIGITIGICLLSRYYIAVWLLLWVFVLLASGQAKKLLKSGIVIIVFVAILYVIPFLSKNWTTLYVSYKAYQDLPLGEWFHINDKHIPIHLYNGTGFAHLFYEHSSFNPNLGYFLLRKILYLVIIGTLIILGLWYWFNRRKIDNRIFLLASFKIYLSVFLAFMVVPYIYLIIPSIFISIAIFAEQSRYRIIDVNEEKPLISAAN
jgi:hypothetical protein